MSVKQGNLSINSENIFPIIKKWLYSDRDIFIRELISNGCDAITKLKKLESIGEYTAPEGREDRIFVVIDRDAKTMRFIDNGIGMTADEVEEYITQIAFSGASAFLEKYKDKTNDEQIIGHFGLGFYSAFMVADKVTIDTLSYLDGAKPVHWECSGGTEYSIEDGERTEAGTEITLRLNEESAEFAEESRVRTVIEKYCSFMPVPIYLVSAEKWDEIIGGEESASLKPINDTTPLWAKAPKDCSDDEYVEFYRKAFQDYKKPLFWIHLNMDYPFNLKGILYFPAITNQYESIQGVIKLYNNRVFIADNIKEVIPEFLLLLKGVIDCPDLPLNVSRSALQNNVIVKKISEYISKKVADRINSMCNSDRAEYEKYWDDISPFIKYGCLKEEKFLERVEHSILFKDLNGKYKTLDEISERPVNDPDEAGEASEETKDDAPGAKKTVVYVTDEDKQGQYIKLYREEALDAVIMDRGVDVAFMTFIEEKDKGIEFVRIDSKILDSAKGKGSEEQLKADGEKLQTLFREKLNLPSLTLTAESLKDTSKAALLTEDEESRRMNEMMVMYGLEAGTRDTETLVLNVENPLVKRLLDNPDNENSELICSHLYDMAVLSGKGLTPDRMEAFLNRSVMMLERTLDK